MGARRKEPDFEMGNIPILAAGSIMDHLEPRYSWHWPFHVNVDLGSWNHWVAGITGINPDITTHIVMMWFAALTCLFLFIPIARSYVDVPRGMRNFLEPLLLYIRDEMT